MKKIILTSAVIALLASCNSKPASHEQIDALVNELYPDMKMVMETENDGEYEIHLMGDVEIDCDRNGQWTSVEDPGGVPVSIVPTRAKQYVDSVYKGRTIVKIEREDFGYKLQLYGKIKLQFDHEGNFLKEDFNVIVVK